MVAAVVLDRCIGWRRILRIPSVGPAPTSFDDRVVVIFDDRAITVFDSCPYPSGTMGRA